MHIYQYTRKQGEWEEKCCLSGTDIVSFCNEDGASWKQRRSVLPSNLLTLNPRNPRKRLPVQVLPVHIHCRDLMEFICRVVVNPLIRIAAGGVECDFIFSIGDLAASALLVNRT